MNEQERIYAVSFMRMFFLWCVFLILVVALTGCSTPGTRDGRRGAADSALGIAEGLAPGQYGAAAGAIRRLIGKQDEAALMSAMGYTRYVEWWLAADDRLPERIDGDRLTRLTMWILQEGAQGLPLPGQPQQPGNGPDIGEPALDLSAEELAELKEWMTIFGGAQ